MKLIFATMLIVFSSFQLTGQDINFAMDDFFQTGDAIEANERCFRLTAPVTWQGGGVWYRKPIDLTEPFNMEIDVSFGCNDEGADGIVFIFHPELTTGYEGEGMGFGGLYPSFGVEMDTYENYHLADPSYDHVSFMAHGNTNHYSGITGAVSLTRQKKNIEDCQAHRVQIKWSPKAKVVQFYFDGDLRVEKEIDLINDIFYRDPIVYWGFTSATGSKYNTHQVCLEKLNFMTVNIFDKRIREQLMNGHKYILEGIDFASGRTSLPEGSIDELNKLVQMMKSNPAHTVVINGFTDSSGNADRNKKLSKQRAEAIAEYLKKRGVDPNKVLFRGHGEKDPIAPNETADGRKKNRRIEIVMQLLRV